MTLRTALLGTTLALTAFPLMAQESGSSRTQSLAALGTYLDGLGIEHSELNGFYGGDIDGASYIAQIEMVVAGLRLEARGVILNEETGAARIDDLTMTDLEGERGGLTLSQARLNLADLGRILNEFEFPECQTGLLAPEDRSKSLRVTFDQFQISASENLLPENQSAEVFLAERGDMSMSLTHSDTGACALGGTINLSGLSQTSSLGDVLRIEQLRAAYDLFGFAPEGIEAVSNNRLGMSLSGLTLETAIQQRPLSLGELRFAAETSVQYGDVSEQIERLLEDPVDVARHIAFDFLNSETTAMNLRLVGLDVDTAGFIPPHFDLTDKIAGDINLMLSSRSGVQSLGLDIDLPDFLNLGLSSDLVIDPPKVNDVSHSTLPFHTEMSRFDLNLMAGPALGVFETLTGKKVSGKFDDIIRERISGLPINMSQVDPMILVLSDWIESIEAGEERFVKIEPERPFNVLSQMVSYLINPRGQLEAIGFSEGVVEIESN